MSKKIKAAFCFWQSLVFLLGTLVFYSSCKSHVRPIVQKPIETPINSVQDNSGFKNLGPQVFDNTIQSGIFTADESGNEILYTVVRGETAHLVGVRLGTKEVFINEPLPGSDGSWDIKVSTEGILYICSSRGKLYKHKVGGEVIEDLGRPLESETYLWDLAVGKDGEIFGASYPGCRVFRYHPKDGFSDVGRGPLVEGENYVRSLVYHSKSDKIFAGIGSHAHLVELNPRTGEKREFLPEQYKDQEFVYNMSLVKDEKYGDKLLMYLTKSYKTLVYNIDTKEFLGEINIPSMSVKGTIKSPTEDIAYFTAGANLYEWPLNGLQARAIAQSNGNALATRWAKDGVLQTFNGRKELVSFHIGSDEREVTQVDIPNLPVRLNFAAVAPGHEVWTGGYLGGSNATYNPLTGKTTRRHGLSQTESMAFLNKEVYFGIYPGCRIYVYDTERDWKVGENPRMIGRIDGQDRPFGGLAVESLNKVYFGTVPTYGKNGGALVEYDKATDKLKSFHNVVQDQSIISLVYSQGLLYGGSSNRGGLGIAPTQQEAKLFIWDPLQRVKIKEIVPVPNAKSISYLAEAPDKKIWGIASGKVFIYDPLSDQVVDRLVLYNFNGDIGQWAPSGIFFHPSGSVYLQDGGTLYRLDPENMEFEVLDRALHHLVMDEKGTFYFLKSKDLWQYKP